MSVRISVITATRNRRRYLERALASVRNQNDPDVEHIVVDCMSTDGTEDLLARYPHLIVIREPDSGVYEAWNKGLRRVSGQIVCLLNSDDEIPAGAFARVRAAFSSQPGVELVSGAVELCKEETVDTTKCVPEPLPKPLAKRLIDDARILSLREQDIGPGIPITNGRYLSRRLIVRVGNFDERYHLVADRDFLLRALLMHPSHIRLPQALYRYHAHAGSLTLSGSSAVDSLARESLKAARQGLVEVQGRLQRSAYRRWHAWALFYMIAREILRGDAALALRLAQAGFRLDRFWPLRVPLPLWRHWTERHVRRGRVVS